MDSFEKEINSTFLKLNIPFVDYGITSSDSISLESIFRNPKFQNLSQNKSPLFRMASMTKPLIAYLTLALLDDYRIDLHESVGTYLPEINNLKIAYKEGGTIKYKKNDVPISFHHLLSFTSGHAYEHHDPIISQLMSKKEIAPMKIGDDSFLQAPLVFTPGTCWGYGISYGWLGKAIEAISGVGLDENLKKYLCQPLGLERTSFNPSRSSKDTLAPVYFRDSDGAYSDISSKITIGLNQFHYGGGGITSSLIDYLKFLQFLLKSMKSNVKNSIVAEMFKNQIGNLGVSSLKSYNQSLVNDYDMYPNIEKTWGYGVLLNNQPLVTGRSADSGSWVGLLNTYFWVDHRYDLAGVFLTQVLPCYTTSVLKAFQAFEELSYNYFKKS
jgi:methyl acetate hydrolase